jgi:hypothetical protein
MGDWIYIGVLGIVYVVLKFGPQDLVMRVIMTVIGKSGLEKVGKSALNAQPDRLTLDPKLGPPAKEEAAGAVKALERRGFTGAGSFSVREMAGLVVHFMAKPADSAVAVVYEHPKIGVWCDMYSRYTDGNSFTVTSAKQGGSLEERPGHRTLRSPGQPPAMLHVRLLNERPAGNLEQIPAAGVAQRFTQAYAESMAWRKAKGISAAEVRGAALEKAS